MQLQAIMRGDRNEATTRIRDALHDAGATIMDVHFFSGVRTVLAFELPSDRCGQLALALRDASVRLDAASREALDGAARGDATTIDGTLAVHFLDGDPDLKRDVPSIPGE